jgi:hypothetical protein
VIFLFIANFAKNLYFSQQQKLAVLRVQGEEEQKKNEVLTVISGIEKQFASYKEQVNVKDASNVVDVMRKVAKLYSVKILSLRPGAPVEMPVYTIYPYEMSIITNDYHVLGKFISALESHKDMYFINNISMQLVPSEVPGEPEKVQASLDVSTILIRD